MEFSAEMVASFLEGEVIGDKEARVWSIAKIEEAQNGDLAFLANPKYENYLYVTGATIVLVNKDFTPKEEVKATMIKVDDAYKAFAGLLDLYIANKPQKKGVSPQAAVDSSVKIGENVYIGAFAVVEAGAVIGDNTKIYPHVYVGDNVKVGSEVILYSGVKIYEECVVGDRVILHSGVVIGA
ncbi:MAG: LpxD N-terminal domain-containing protein, partial [Rikenellaceae bacterium]